MSINSIMAIGKSGMRAHESRMANTAQNVANASSTAYRRLETQMATQQGGGVEARTRQAPEGPVDLASEMVDMKQSEIGYKASAAVFEAGADLWDVLKTIGSQQKQP